MKTKVFCTFLLLVNSMIIPVFLVAQEPIQIKKLANPIDFDGRPFEEAWDNLYIFPMVVSSPNFMSAPSEESEIMITYDDEYLWVGARLYAKDASTIVSNSKKRDEMVQNSDVFSIILDTYNDNENASCFVTMPSGARTDVAISGDASIQGLNSNWNTFWDVMTSRDEKGWYVEMRIPFTSLRFQPVNNVTTMGLILYRYISHANEMVTYPAINPRYGTTAHLKPSLASEIQLEISKTKRPVYISPYVIGGYSRNWKLNEVQTGYIQNNKTPFDVGVDVKYSINSNLTLDLTVNPDFAQVEADDQQVNMTRYSLFFPEKRTFFQEGSNIFDFNLLGFTRLFHSRNIGLQAGNPVTILGGARLYGSVGKWDLGILEMQTEKTATIPGENFAVFRAKRQVFNPYSNIGGMFTSKVGSDGRNNFAYGVDGNIRIFGDDYLMFRYAHTFDNRISEAVKKEGRSVEPVFLYAGLNRRTQTKLYYLASVKYTGRDFYPGVGYVQKPGLYGVYINAGYGLMPGEKSPVFLHGPTFVYDLEKRLSDKGLDWQLVSGGWQLQTKSGFRATASVRHEKHGVRWAFPISNISIPAGDYRFTSLNTQFSNSAAKKFSYTLDAVIGQMYDGEGFNLRFMPKWNVSSSLQLGAMYAYNTLRFPSRQTNDKLNIHMRNINGLYMFNTRLSVSAFLQYENTTDNLISNLRIRYNPREGNDLYIVFNDMRRIGKRNITPEPPPFFNNTVMLKYTHTFTLKI